MKKISVIFLAILTLSFGSAPIAQAATPGLVVDEMGFVSVYEGGASDSYTIALATAPTASVTVNLTAPTNQLVVLPATLTFTTANWNTPQLVTVEAFDDLIYEQSHSAMVTQTTTSTDAAYANLSATVTASITDNDAFGNNGGKDLQMPDAPTNITLISDGKAITVTWKDSTAPDLRSVDILRNDGGTTPVNGEALYFAPKGEQKFVDTLVVAGQTYQYQLRAKDWSGNSRLTGEFSVKNELVAPYSAPAPVVTPPTPTTPAPVAPPVVVVEGDAITRAQIIADAKEFGLELNGVQAMLLSTFVTNSVADGVVAAYAQQLGTGERRALVRDYFDTVNRPIIVWDDLARLANGQKPGTRNLTREQAQAKAALALWIKIKYRAPNFKNATEDLAWNTLMYRIRFTRDLGKEQAGILKFRATFKRTPVSPLDWAMVRALGYVL